jgi:hypothetical protein
VWAVVLDGGFNFGTSNSALADLRPQMRVIAGRQEPVSKDGTGRARTAG